MHRFGLYLFSVMGILLTLQSCSDKFDPNADYKETAVIYALLNPAEKVHYVKVNKAFLNTNTNALLIAATQPDSTQFYDAIEVTLLKLQSQQDTSVVATYPLHAVTVTDKEAGDFSYPEQVVYATDSISLTDDGTYRVKVKNTATGKEYYGTTSMVNPFCVSQVSYAFLTCPNQPGPPTPIEPQRYMNPRFKLSPNAEIYMFTYYIHYTEYKPNGTDTVAVNKTIAYAPIYNEIIPYRPLGEYNISILPNTLFQFINYKIDTSTDIPGMYRRMQHTEVVVTAGGRELKRYVQVNNVYSAITQTRPYYSNVINGTGLVSSRRTITLNGYFTNSAIDSLSSIFPQLKFRR